MTLWCGWIVLLGGLFTLHMDISICFVDCSSLFIYFTCGLLILLSVDVRGVVGTFVGLLNVV